MITLIVCFQAELEQVLAQFEEADAKCSALSKNSSSLDSQLTDAQELAQEETRQKLAVQSKLRQAEDKMEGLEDQLEQEEESRRAVENKLNNLNVQVSCKRLRKSMIIVRKLNLRYLPD